MKKYLIIIISSLVVVIAVIASILLFKEDFNDKINEMRKSINDTTKVEIITKLEEQDIVVYQFEKLVEYKNENTCDVIETTKTLSNTFELKAKTDEKYNEEVDRSTLYALNLVEDLLIDYKEENGIITFSVNSENIKTVMNNDDLVIVDVATFEIDYTENRLNKILIKFTIESTRNVTIETSYSY